MQKTDFKDVKFMTAKEKYAVYKLFKRFVENGFKREDFARVIYDHLYLHCGFIAHYNIDAFYVTYFNGDKNDLKDFIEYFINDSGDYSSNAVWGDYKDIGIKMADILKKII